MYQTCLPYSNSTLAQSRLCAAAAAAEATFSEAVDSYSL